MRQHIPFAALLLACGAAFASAGDPDASTLDKKVLFGYQGWFNCAGDGAPENNWRSWARGVPAAETLTVDMYPDLSEFDRADLCAVPGMTLGGKQAYLASAWNPKVVATHFRWMKEYGLDGVLIQRFVTNIARKRASGDVVLKNILKAAAESGRVVAIEYDVTGSNLATFAEVMREDWKYLVDELKITAHPGYLHHNGKAVLSIWGPGLKEDRHVLSVGDVVLSGGEVAACLVIEAVTRLLPGAMGNAVSPLTESFGAHGLLEEPHYTRPATFRGWDVPEVLRSGDHVRIERWRQAQALHRTVRDRPDLIDARGGLTELDRRLLEEFPAVPYP